MFTKYSICIVLTCIAMRIEGTWQRYNCQINGTEHLGVLRQEVDYTGGKHCTWKVPKSVFENNYTIIIMIDNITVSSSEDSCRLLLPGDQNNGACRDMGNTCWVYQKESLCNTSDISRKIAAEKIECRDVTTNNSITNSIEIEYHSKNSTSDYNVTTFRMIYKATKCQDSTEVSTSFERRSNIEKGGDNSIVIPKNTDEVEPLSTEKTIITVTAVIIGTITIILIVVAIIKRERSHGRTANNIELDSATKESSERNEDLYSPHRSFKETDEIYDNQNMKEVTATNETTYFPVS